MSSQACVQLQGYGWRTSCLASSCKTCKIPWDQPHTNPLIFCPTHAGRKTQWGQNQEVKSWGADVSSTAAWADLGTCRKWVCGPGGDPLSGVKHWQWVSSSRVKSQLFICSSLPSPGNTNYDFSVSSGVKFRLSHQFHWPSSYFYFPQQRDGHASSSRSSLLRRASLSPESITGHSACKDMGRQSLDWPGNLCFSLNMKNSH